MSYKSLLITVLAIVCIAAACLSFRRTNPPTPQPQPISQISSGTLFITRDLTERLKVADTYGILKIKVIGRSTENRPIYLFKLSTGTRRKRLFIMCRQHGHEPGSAIAFLQLLQTALQDGAWNSYLKSMDIYAVPEPNPDGAFIYTRWDSHGNDLNRQWDSPTAPEVRTLKTTISSLHPDLVLDMHDFGYGGSFIEAYNDGSKASSVVGAICRKLQTQIKRNTDPTCRVAYSNLKNNPGLAHRVIIHQFGIPAVLVESSGYGDYAEDSRCIETHKIAIITVLRYLAAK